MGRRLRPVLAGQAGLTLIEIVVTTAVMAMVVGSLSLLVGAATRGKMIASTRSADTETARQTLEWISERLRNAGLNINPSAQGQTRCKDMVVAQDASLRPQSGSVYVSGEILNSNTTAGDQVITVGYRLVSGAVMEDSGSCSGPWSPTTSQVSNPRVQVTGLVFRYFERNGDEVAVPTTNVTAIQSIRLIRIDLSVQSQEGTSGAQSQTFTRMVMLRNPQPDRNAGWLSPLETNP